jgi:hypothetical protein
MMLDDNVTAANKDAAAANRKACQHLVPGTAPFAATYTSKTRTRPGALAAFI